MSKYNYVFIGANGYQALIEQDHPLTLEQMQDYVDGPIEFLAVKGGTEEICVNEEGRLQHLPVNHTASVLRGGIVVGDVLLASRETFADEEEDADA